MARRRFDLLRAVFWLLAIMLILELLTSIAGGVLCWWVNYTTVRQPGACLQVTQVIRELWAELLTAVLALLLAARSPPPGGPDDE